MTQSGDMLVGMLGEIPSLSYIPSAPSQLCQLNVGAPGSIRCTTPLHKFSPSVPGG